MVTKKEFLPIMLSLALAIFLSVTLANAAIQIISPANGTNNTGTITFNVTFLNNTDQNVTGIITTITNVNATFYLEVEGATPLVVNNTADCTATGVLDEIACVGIVASSSLTDGIYNISAQIFNVSAEPVNGTANSTFVLIDTTSPRIEESNVTSPLTGNNYSEITNGIVTINVSVFDQTHGNVSVYINITNATSGLQNATIGVLDTIGGLNNYGNDWNGTFNTSHFPDGTYNITVWANDTVLGNVNSSAYVYTIQIDNTKPTASLSCTPDPVDEGEQITCTCTTSDARTGVRSVADEVHPTTASAGSFSTTCEASDYTGNKVSTSVTYTVSSVGYTGGASTGGTGGGTGGGTSATPSSQKSKSWTTINPGDEVIVRDLGIAYGIKEISIEVSEKADNPKVSVKKYDSRPAEVPVEKKGAVYKHLEIETTNLADKINKATITIQVEKSWVESNNLDKENVALFKFTDGKWQELTTTFKEESGGNYIYDAEVASFSFFAIGEKGSEEVGTTPGGETPGAGGTTGEETTKSSWILWVSIIAVIVVVVVFFVLKKKRK